MPLLSLRQLRAKIRSTQKTAQITKTMQMVSASRLKKSQEVLRQATPYAKKIESILTHLQQTGLEITHPFFAPREVGSVVLVVVASDRGLCGSYNANIIAQAEAFLAQPRPQEVSLVLVGKKGADYFKNKQWPILHQYLDISGKVDYAKIARITRQLTDDYLAGKVDEIQLLFSHYLSAMSIQPMREKFLNLQRPASQAAQPIETILEPNLNEVLERLLPEYIASKMYISIISAFTAENSARMIAMKAATDNAKEMIGKLTLQRNKVRQAAITKEILEIVTAGEALKG
jgi:F-type H+-transporting ATPase subunit gamma